MARRRLRSPHRPRRRRHVELGYRPDGRLDHVDNLDDHHGFTYDARGQLATQTTTEGLYAYGYDELGRNTRIDFPDGHRDNFGHPFGLLNYDYTWHVGDRTTILSQGLLDPWGDAARAFNVGLLVDRPDRLAFYLGFRHIDPVGTDAVVAATTYALSPKYVVTWATSYDFGDNKWHTAPGNDVGFDRPYAIYHNGLPADFLPITNGCGEFLLWEFPLAFWWAHSRTLRFADGPDEVHRRQIGRLELRKHS